MSFMNYVLSQKQNTLLKDRLADKLQLNHIQEYELFCGHFNPVYEAIWVLAEDYFTKKEKDV